MNFTDNPFERMMRQRPGTDSGHPCKHCRHKWECGYLLHQCRKKFRSVLGDTAPPVAGAVHPRCSGDRWEVSNRAGRSQRENNFAVHQRRKNHCTDFESSPDKAAGRDGQEETAGERRKKANVRKQVGRASRVCKRAARRSRTSWLRTIISSRLTGWPGNMALITV